MIKNKNSKIIFLEQKQSIKGSALAYGLIIMTVVSIILVSILQYISAQIMFSLDRVNREQAFQIAESGINVYKWYLNHETSGKTAEQVQAFWQENPQGVDTPYINEYFDPEGGAIGRYQIEVEPPSNGSTMAIVKSTGWTYKNPNSKRSIQVRFRRPALCEYAVVANDDMRFGPGTEVYGPIHSNFGIRFDGLAHNLISSSAYQYDDPDHNGDNEYGVHTHIDPINGSVGNNFVAAEAPDNPLANRPDVFMAGRELERPEIDFNGFVMDLNFMKSESQISGRGIYYNNDKCSNKDNLGRHIIINGNTMTVTTVTEYNNANYSIKKEGCALNNVAIPNDGIIFVENNIWVEGTINGRRVTFVAANISGGEKASIYLGMNNILYTNFDGSDIIGLLAQKDIEVVKDSLSTLTINAALLSQSGRVGRNYYTPFGCHSQSCQDHKGIITIMGSVATYLRYGFAYTDGTGFSQRILNFDNDLLYYQPPYFPTSNNYEMDLWQEL